MNVRDAKSLEPAPEEARPVPIPGPAQSIRPGVIFKGRSTESEMDFIPGDRVMRKGGGADSIGVVQAVNPSDVIVKRDNLRATPPRYGCHPSALELIEPAPRPVAAEVEAVVSDPPPPAPVSTSVSDPAPPAPVAADGDVDPVPATDPVPDTDEQGESDAVAAPADETPAAPAESTTPPSAG